MLKINKIQNKDIYQFEIDGKVDEKGVKDFYSLLETTAEQKDKVRLLGVINDFPTFKNFKALSSGMKIKPEAVKSIGKYAVLSDENWVDATLPFGNFLTPGIPIKRFALDEKDKAIYWLQKDEKEEVSPEAYFTKMEISQVRGTNIYSFKIDKTIDEAGITALYNIVNKQLKEDKVRLMGIINGFPSIESFKTFIQGIKLDFALLGKVEKYAVVTDQGWVKKLSVAGDMLTPGLSMKVFSMEEKDEAIDWLKT